MTQKMVTPNQPLPPHTFNIFTLSIARQAAFRLPLYAMSYAIAGYLNKLFQKLSTFTGENSETNYADTREISKKSQLTPRICYQIQLSQIPGISTKIAECIIEQYQIGRAHV